jgi:hypothetical protein
MHQNAQRCHLLAQSLASSREYSLCAGASQSLRPLSCCVRNTLLTPDCLRHNRFKGIIGVKSEIWDNFGEKVK